MTTDEFDRLRLEGARQAYAFYDSVLLYHKSGLTIEEFINGELMLGLDKEVAETVDGRYIYGDGNFEVVLVPFKTWMAIPKAVAR